MKSLHVRLSDEEEAILQEQAARLNCSVSELVRGVLFREKEPFSEPKFDSSDRVETLETRLASMAETLRNLPSLSEKLTTFQETIELISELVQGQSELIERVENAEKEVHALAENVLRLVDCQTEERRTPFGMDLAFFQSATMAGFTLARGTFSHNPEAWEPYKEEARRRAFKPEGGEP